MGCNYLSIPKPIHVSERGFWWENQCQIWTTRICTRFQFLAHITFRVPGHHIWLMRFLWRLMTQDDIDIVSGQCVSWPQCRCTSGWILGNKIGLSCVTKILRVLHVESSFWKCPWFSGLEDRLVERFVKLMYITGIDSLCLSGALSQPRFGS